MKNDIITNPDKSIDAQCAPKKNFKGYSIGELRYQRALIALQKEFCKSKVIHRFDRLRNNKAGSGARSSKFAVAGNVASKILSGLSYVDYLMLGVSVFGSARKVFRFIKGKRH